MNPFGFIPDKKDLKLLLGPEGLHYTNLNVKFFKTYRCSLLEGTALAITDYDTFDWKIHVYNKAKLNAKWQWNDTNNFNPPVIFWSELKICKVRRIFDDDKDFYEELIKLFPMLKIFRETPESPIIIQPDDNYVLVTDISPHNIGFVFGVFCYQKHLIAEVREDLSLEELKMLQDKAHKDFVFCYLQNIANRKDSKIPWAYLADDCYINFLSKINKQITEKENK